ncbi:protein ALP1-like [Lycium barbarum]|uniref:protein ALP1-like n=1 Tax=Lycium barbarum TaxID=112863 RepID=UPI00293ECB75|nr:protein ALP1-like [Lycium barbarum]
MDRKAFHFLASLATNIGGLTDSNNMSTTKKLAMFLNISAHYEKNSPNPVAEDETDDRWKWFKGCLGALDGTYIPIRVLTIYKPRYRTRKGDITTNVLGVSDRNLNFTYVLPGWEGSAADGRVLRDVVVRRNGLKVPEGGYTNGNGFLSRYRGYRYWLRDWQGDNPSPQCQEELFNMKHARARNVIKREFGVVKGRCGILKSPSWYSVKIHTRIISACCLLHNFIRREMEVDPLDMETEFNMEHQHEHEHGNIDTVEPSDEWTTWRDELAQSMWNERSGN